MMERPVMRGTLSTVEDDEESKSYIGPPFELEMVEAALIVATGMVLM